MSQTRASQVESTLRASAASLEHPCKLWALRWARRFVILRGSFGAQCGVALRIPSWWFFNATRMRPNRNSSLATTMHREVDAMYKQKEQDFIQREDWVALAALRERESHFRDGRSASARLPRR